jgi:hypothetical protein
MHAARLTERLEGYKVPLVTGTTPLEWLYDEERKSRLRVNHNGRERYLEPFHSAVSAAGWPGPRGQRAVKSEVRSPKPEVQAAGAVGPRPSGVLAYGRGWAGQTAERRAPRPRTGGGRGDPGQGLDARGRPADAAGAAPPWPTAEELGDPPEAVPAGATLKLGDTAYVEPLRDLVGYAHMLGRVI